jgi:hypothetical protein
MTSLKSHPSDSAPSASAIGAQAAPWPSVRPGLASDEARDHDAERVERTATAVRHRRGQDWRSAAIIGSIVAIGSLAWLLFTR